MDPAKRLELVMGAIDLAQDAYERADYIDSTARRDRVRAEYASRLAALRTQAEGLKASLRWNDDLFGPLQDWETK